MHDERSLLEKQGETIKRVEDSLDREQGPESRWSVDDAHQQRRRRLMFWGLGIAFAIIAIIVVSVAISLKVSSGGSKKNMIKGRMLVHNATVFLPSEDDPMQYSMMQNYGIIIQDGKFTHLGPSNEIFATFAGDFKASQILNAQQNYLFPGFTDSHAHLLNLGTMLSQADLVGSQSPDQVVTRLLAYTSQSPFYRDGDWVMARGWDQNLFPTQQFPTHQDLDTSFPDWPVWLSRVDGHAAWANQAAMDLADIPEVDPPGGTIVRDTQGRPTGIFIDNAMDIINRVVPPISKRLQKDRLKAAVAECHKYGITGIHDAGVYKQTMEVIEELIEDNEWYFRFYAMISSDSEEYTTDSTKKRQAVIDYWCNKGQKNVGENQLVVRSVKMYIDGALGSRGAALLEPYTDDSASRGLLLIPEVDFSSETTQWIECDFQVNAHAIGDRGNRVALNGFQNATEFLQLSAERRRELRLRVEHSQIVTPEDQQRFKQMDIIASMQPTHATSDMFFAPLRLGNRTDYAYTWRSFLNLGVALPFGSDFPVERVDPLLGVFASITRQNSDLQPPGGWYPNQRLNSHETLYAFTQAGAHASFQENVMGSIEVGKYGDFVLLNRNILAVDPLQILDTQVLRTVVGGNIVYST